MERIEIAGAWEGDALPGGRFCAAFPDGRVLTHRGTWMAPEWLRYPRLHPTGDRLAGSRHSTPGAVVVLEPGAWGEVALQSCGVSAVLYLPDGELMVNRDCADPYYSLGFRFFRDRVYSGSETYADPVRQIFEWTEYDGITIGQGPEDGVHVLHAGRRYLLEAGPCRVVRFTKAGELLAVACTRADRGFVALWFTVAEIALLPEILEPPPPVEDPLKPPIVTVHRWTLNELEDGREFTFTDSANPALGYLIRVHVAGGSMYAEISNAAGKASTGLERPVKPCEEEGPPDPPPDPDPVSSEISTYHGLFWHTARDGRIEQSDTAEAYALEQIAPGKFAIRTMIPELGGAGGRYVAAELSAAPPYYLIANREAPGGWETFTAGPSGDEDRPLGITLKADNGRFVSAEKDGRITCNRESGGPWETFGIDRPIVTLPRLEIDGQYFRLATGERFHCLEASEFSLYKRYLENEPIDHLLAERSGLGFNLLRVWLLNTSVIPGGLLPSQYSDFYENLRPFLARCESFGLRVELTAFTQASSLMPDPHDQLDHWSRVVAAVSSAPNVLLELGNELDQHDNATAANFPRPVGVLASGGSNGSDQWPPEPHWDYCLYHTNDAPEWMRRAGHNSMEVADHHQNRPTMANENTRAPDRDSDPDHFYDAAAGAALLCAGICFHSVHGKTSEPFDATELELARQFIAGSRSVPLEYQPGLYARHDEENGPDCIRAYSRTLPDGRSWMVKIRP